MYKLPGDYTAWERCCISRRSDEPVRPTKLIVSSVAKLHSDTASTSSTSAYAGNARRRFSPPPQPPNSDDQAFHIGAGSRGRWLGIPRQKFGDTAFASTAWRHTCSRPISQLTRLGSSHEPHHGDVADAIDSVTTSSAAGRVQKNTGKCVWQHGYRCAIDTTLQPHIHEYSVGEQWVSKWPI